MDTRNPKKSFSFLIFIFITSIGRVYHRKGKGYITMGKEHEFITRGEEVFLLTEDTKTVRTKLSLAIW